MLKRIIQRLKRSKICAVNALEEPPDMGHTRDWSGPEIPLDPKSQPIIISNLVCDILSEAAKKKAIAIKFSLPENSGDIDIEYTLPQGKEQSPELPGYLWYSLVTTIPRFTSLESCEGVPIDPATKEKWQFKYTKSANTFLLNKLNLEGN